MGTCGGMTTTSSPYNWEPAAQLVAVPVIPQRWVATEKTLQRHRPENAAVRPSRESSLASRAACNPSGQWRSATTRPVNSSTISMRPLLTM